MTEPCRACGAAMADDQRYCLNCGERRGAPRVDSRSHLDAAGPGGGATPEATPKPPAGPPAPQPERRQRDYAPLAAAGGIAVLGIMLLIGVLIGRGTGATSGENPAPQVVRVESGGSESGGAAPEEESAGGAGQATAGGSGKRSGKSGKAARDAAAGTGDAPVASDRQLQELQEQSPEEYSESSAKLPDEIATPGEAPATDNKAPGGGGGGTTIE
jgi:hypothetical protein